MEEAGVRVAESLIIKGAVTEVVCREASSKYRHAPGQLAELQEEVEEIMEALQAVGLVLVGIKEAWCSKKRTRLRGVQE